MKKLCIWAMLAVLGPAVPSRSAETVSFADAAVEAVCVSHWDTDGDGRLSAEEAAAVTSLGQAFRGNKSVTSFPELAYFTGLTSISDYAFFQSSLRSVVLPPSVDTIGEYAFAESGIGPELVVPGHVRHLAACCFQSCQQLSRVVLEEGVETLGFKCFSGPVTLLSLPSSLTAVSSMAIDPYVNAYPGTGIFIPKGDLTVVVRGAVPAAVDYYAFYHVFAEGRLIVPPGSVAAYKSASGWSHFGEYIEAGDVNGDGRLDVADVAALVSRVTGTVPARFNEYAADFNGDGQVDARDIAPLCRYVLTVSP